MIKKKKERSLGYYRAKADKKIQELGMEVYDRCLVCGGEYSCLHHFIHKSQSTELRYNWLNLIPVCNKCHCAIHQGKNDLITAKIAFIKGKEWLEEIESLKKQGIGKYYGKQYYKNVLESLPFKTN